jgi:hypothetical protein
MEAEYIEDGILKTLRQADGAVGLPELMRRMGLRAAHRRLLRQALRTLIDAGQIKELSNKHYVSARPPREGDQGKPPRPKGGFRLRSRASDLSASSPNQAARAPKAAPRPAATTRRAIFTWPNATWARQCRTTACL